MLGVCATFSLRMLNGQGADMCGACTCFKHNGSSTPDYMFVRGSFSAFSVVPSLVGSLSDHAALLATVPWAVPHAVHPSTDSFTVYRWVEGSNLADYSHSWRAWNRYTDSPGFASEFEALIDAHSGDLDELAAAVESFLLRNALAAGVVTKQYRFVAANPNKQLKQLAPWFTEECRSAKHAYKAAVKQFGRQSAEATTASQHFSKCCSQAKMAFSATLPDMLKYRPRQFYAYAHAHPHVQSVVPPAAFATALG